MGFFSWKTQDTHVSIANRYQKVRPVFKVIMTDDKGNKWEEDNYEGYGVFGGKDYYELLAEMNGKRTRDEGIDLAYPADMAGCLCKDVLYPSLSESGAWFGGASPEECEYQGFFYDADIYEGAEDE